MDDIMWQLLLLLAFGLLQLFFGYPLFRILVVLAGAAIGFAYGPELLADLTGRPPVPWMAFAAAVALAVVLGLLAWLAFWAVVFLWGASVGYAVVDAGTTGAMLPLLAALVVGVVAVIFQRFLIVALTALSGAWLTTIAGSALLGVAPPGTAPLQPAEPWLLVVILVLAVFGAVVQFRRAVPDSGL